jgi:hypothetical protein
MAPVAGLEFSGNKLVMCNVSGKVVVRDLTSELEESSYWQTTITDPVTCFKMHPSQQGIAVSGGKENDVEIVQILPRDDDPPPVFESNNTNHNTSTDSMSPELDDELGEEDDDVTGIHYRLFQTMNTLRNRRRAWERQQQQQQQQQHDNDLDDDDDDYDDETRRISTLYGLSSELPLLMNSHRAAVNRRLGTGGRNDRSSSRILHRHSRRNQRLWRIWKAKNVGNDQFGNPVPVWVSDVQFLDPDRPMSEGWKLAVATRFGEIRLYDTKCSRGPLLNIIVSNHPLVNLWFGLTENELLFSDSQNVIRRFNWTQATYGEIFRGPAAGGLQIDQQEHNVLAMGGLDKYLRVYDLTGQLKYKVNIFSRISGVLVLDGNEIQEPPEQRGQLHQIDHSDEDEPENKRQRR